MPYKEICTCATRFMRPLTLLLAITLPGIEAAYADGNIRWDFRGFGSIAGATTDTDRAEYRLDLLQGKGATSDIDWGLHSNLGAQLTAQFGEQFSVTGQAVAKRRGVDDMDPDLEWLYASYRPTSWLDLRAGRMVMPEFLISDYRWVGYAQPTIGPPSTVYMYGSITQFEGAQMVNTISVGEGILSFQASAGSSEEEFYFMGPGVGSDTEMDDIVGLALSYEWGNWLVRASDLDGEISTAGLGAMDAEFEAFSAQYDNGSLFVTMEDVDRAGVAEARYLTLGYRFGKWQPAVTVTESEIVNFFGPDIESDTTALTLRYDVTDNMAAKIQWQEIPPSNFWMWHTADFTFFGLDEEQEVTSFSLDFIF